MVGDDQIDTVRYGKAWIAEVQRTLARLRTFCLNERGDHFFLYLDTLYSFATWKLHRW